MTRRYDPYTIEMPRAIADRKYAIVGGLETLLVSAGQSLLCRIVDRTPTVDPGDRYKSQQ